jgi:copper chaperone CopZ
MICGGSAGNATHPLEAIEGISAVEVSLSAGEAAVQYDKRLTLPDQLKSAMKGAGYA